MRQRSANLPPAFPAISLAVAVILFFASPGWADFQINESSGVHERPRVSMCPNKGFVTVWTDKSTKDVLARYYNRKGLATGDEIAVASTGDDEKDPSVGMADDGSFVVVWQNNTSSHIVAQRFDASGTPVDGEIAVSNGAGSNFGHETSSGQAQGGFENRQVAGQVVLPENGTVKSITAYIDGKSKDVRYAIYSDKNGEPDQRLAQTAAKQIASGWAWRTIELPDVALTAGTYWLAIAFDKDEQLVDRATTGGALRVANHDAERKGFRSPWGSSESSSSYELSIYATVGPPDGDHEKPRVAAAADGSFVVAWTEKDADDVLAQRYDSLGNALGSHITVASDGDEHKEVCLAATPDGSFVVAWENKSAGDVFAQRYDSSGIPLGDRIQVTWAADEEKSAAVSVADDGSFIVAWHNNTEDDIYAQRYDPSGNTIGGVIRVTNTPSSDEAVPTVSTAVDGSFVVAWQDSTDDAILAQRFDSNGVPLDAAIHVSTSANQDERPSVGVNPLGTFVVVWSSKVDRNSQDIFGQLFSKQGDAVLEWKTEWRVKKWQEIAAP